MKFSKLIFIASSLILSNIASAGIINAPIGTANPLLVDSLQSDENIYMFTEQQDVTLQSNLSVDQLVNSSNLTLDSSPSLGELIEGTSINSYLFHFDAITVDPNTVVGNSPGSRSIQDTYTFDSIILAVIWSGPTNAGSLFDRDYLTKSDYLAGTQEYYPSGSGLGRGLEPSTLEYLNAGTQDYFSISSDLSTISFDLKVNPIFADQIRVITAVKVPEPTTLLLFGSAVIFLLNLRRFR